MGDRRERRLAGGGGRPREGPEAAPAHLPVRGRGVGGRRVRVGRDAPRGQVPLL